jgi:sugar diacid utilization regulator
LDFLFVQQSLFSYNNKIIFFGSSQDPASETSIMKHIESSLTWWNEHFAVTARAGISTGNYYPGQAEENHSKAEKALLHLKTQNKEGLLHYKDIGISRLFLHHSQEEIHSFLRESFGSLWEKKENEELLDTLFAYIQNNRSMGVTAKQLHIHTNTLYNRLRKIEEMLGLDFNQYEDDLHMQLAVYLYQTFVERSSL